MTTPAELGSALIAAGWTLKENPGGLSPADLAALRDNLNAYLASLADERPALAEPWQCHKCGEQYLELMEAAACCGDVVIKAAGLAAPSPPAAPQTASARAQGIKIGAGNGPRYGNP